MEPIIYVTVKNQNINHTVMVLINHKSREVHVTTLFFVASSFQDNACIDDVLCHPMIDKDL